MEKLIDCSILTLESLVYEGQIASAILMADDGEMGVLHNHAPLISKLGLGGMKINLEKETREFFIDGGLVEVNNNKLIVLAEAAMPKESLDKTELESRLSEVEKLLSDAGDSLSQRSDFLSEQKKLKAKLSLFEK